MNAATSTTDHRALLHTIRGRLVRAVANEVSPYADALFGVVLERQRRWLDGEWSAVLVELDKSQLTIQEFLHQESARK